jgi:thiopurine S-methyltransferase
MEANFWHQKWEKGEIGFHRSEVNTLLIENVGKLNLAKGSRIFLPLCGKTLDCSWLLASGYRVVGAELSEVAIRELFKELGVEPIISKIGNLELYTAKNIEIFVGNIFDVTAQLLGQVDAVYDRAALVALPLNMREKYTSHLIKITDIAPQLLITYEYNQQLIDGPPFSITEEEVKHHYANTYELKSVAHKEIVGGLRGNVASSENVYLLQKPN